MLPVRLKVNYDTQIKKSFEDAQAYYAAIKKRNIREQAKLDCVTKILLGMKNKQPYHLIASELDQKTLVTAREGRTSTWNVTRPGFVYLLNELEAISTELEYEAKKEAWERQDQANTVSPEYLNGTHPLGFEDNGEFNANRLWSSAFDSKSTQLTWGSQGRPGASKFPESDYVSRFSAVITAAPASVSTLRFKNGPRVVGRHVNYIFFSSAALSSLLHNLPPSFYYLQFEPYYILNSYQCILTACRNNPNITRLHLFSEYQFKRPEPRDFNDKLADLAAIPSIDTIDWPQLPSDPECLLSAAETGLMMDIPANITGLDGFGHALNSMYQGHRPGCITTFLNKQPQIRLIDVEGLIDARLGRPLPPKHFQYIPTEKYPHGSKEYYWQYHYTEAPQAKIKFETVLQELSEFKGNLTVDLSSSTLTNFLMNHYGVAGTAELLLRYNLNVILNPHVLEHPFSDPPVSFAEAVTTRFDRAYTSLATHLPEVLKNLVISYAPKIYFGREAYEQERREKKKLTATLPLPSPATSSVGLGGATSSPLAGSTATDLVALSGIMTKPIVTAAGSATEEKKAEVVRSLP